MLQQKPIEWRRFERVQLEGDVAKPAPLNPSSLPPQAATPAAAHAPATSTPSLLHEFERVLRENERLRLDLSRLREKVAENTNGTPDRRKEQRRSRPDISLLASDHELQTASQVEESKTHIPDVPTPAAAKESIAQVVAGYIFDKPTEQNIRLIADALRGRGISLE